MAGCAILTLLASRGETSAGPIPGELYLLPVWTGLGLGLLGVARGAFAPSPAREDVGSRKDREQLRRARNRAAFEDLGKPHPT